MQTYSTHTRRIFADIWRCNSIEISLRFDIFSANGIRHDNNTRIFIAAFVHTGFRLRVCIKADARTNCVGARQGNFPWVNSTPSFGGLWRALSYGSSRATSLETFARIWQQQDLSLSGRGYGFSRFLPPRWFLESKMGRRRLERKERESEKEGQSGEHRSPLEIV